MALPPLFGETADGEGRALSPPDGPPWHDHPLFAIDSVYRAYRRCRRRKRNTRKALELETNLEEELFALRRELVAGSYRPQPFDAFLVRKPKLREIFAASFRDRVVHHLLVGHLEPRWERRFIHDSYACRKGRGTHRAVERLRAFTRRATQNGTRRAWYLQLDVRGFFVAIDRRRLYRQLAAVEHDSAVLRLLRVVLFSDPRAGCHFRGSKRADFEKLPAHKTLWKSAPGCGLPIGNLTSQFFANVYLDPLDQFVKHELRARFYVRYCDDLVLVSEDRGELLGWERQVESFLRERLGLELNARRRLRPVSDGIDFLGYIVRPSHLLVRRRVVHALRERLDGAERQLQERGMGAGEEGRSVYPWPWPLINELRSWLAAYGAHLARASSTGIFVSLAARYPWIGEYFPSWPRTLDVRCAVPRHALRLAEQRTWFREHLPGHVLVTRLGRFCEISEPRVARVAGTTDTGTAAGAGRPRRVHRRRLPDLLPELWRSGRPIAWTHETGRRLSGIAERALAWRWSAASSASATTSSK